MSLTLAATACAALEEDTGSSADEVIETNELFGDDRVADALKTHLDKIPNNYAQAEKVFGVGRSCARTDSKEMFTVEEAQTRTDGEASTTTDILPRTVITGCNTPEHTMAEANDPQSGSFSLFIALFSDPGMPDAAKGDTMVVDRVETIALDRKTGLYNFYVFTPGPKADGPGKIERIKLMPNNDVMSITLAPKATAVKKEKSADRACNNCHVNMGLLMNEMHEPWTNWVSTRKKLPEEAKLAGETKSIVDEAVSTDGKHSRVSFANDMEKTILSGIRVWAEGFPGNPKSGFVQQTLDAQLPRGAAGLLKSSFCETELQYESGFDVAPLELFVDPNAVQGSQIQRPQSVREDIFPILMPVRSEMDKRIEFGGLKKRMLSLQTSIAIRLFDEQNDIFSKKRCDLYPKVTKDLPTDITKIDAHVRKALNAELAAIPAGARKDYATALLKDGASAEVSTARAKYFDDVKARVATDIQKLQTPAGRKELKKISQARKDAAQQMFRGSKVPLPLLEDEKL